MRKICPKCKTEKSLEDFNKTKRLPDGRECYCRSCKKLYNKNLYKTNDHYRNAVQTNRNNYKLQNQFYVRKYLLNHPCIDCGESDPIVLEFDHINQEEKTYDVSVIASSGTSLTLVINEIDKCEVRCANCHRRKTAIQFGWYSLLDGYLSTIKNGPII